MAAISSRSQLVLASSSSPDAESRRPRGGERIRIDVERFLGVDGQQPLEACARRELEEETGWRANTFERLTTLLTTPGFTDERIHLFMASELSPAQQNLQDDEVIELVPMAFRDALDLVWNGQIEDGKTALALIHAARRLGAL